jgi:hypothetical protein
VSEVIARVTVVLQCVPSRRLRKKQEEAVGRPANERTKSTERRGRTRGAACSTTRTNPTRETQPLGEIGLIA